MKVQNAIDRDIARQLARLKALKKIRAVLAPLSEQDVEIVIDSLRDATADPEGGAQ